MDKVKKLISAGLSIPSAVKESIDVTLSEFAAKYDLELPDVSAAINGNRRPTDKVVAAFVSELGGTGDEWRELFWLAGKPASSSPAA